VPSHTGSCLQLSGHLSACLCARRLNSQGGGVRAEQGAERWGPSHWDSQPDPRRHTVSDHRERDHHTRVYCHTRTGHHHTGAVRCPRTGQRDILRGRIAPRGAARAQGPRSAASEGPVGPVIRRARGGGPWAEASFTTSPAPSHLFWGADAGECASRCLPRRAPLPDLGLGSMPSALPVWPCGMDRCAVPHGRGAGRRVNNTASGVSPKIPGHTSNMTFSLAAEYATWCRSSSSCSPLPGAEQGHPLLPCLISVITAGSVSTQGPRSALSRQLCALALRKAEQGEAPREQPLWSLERDSLLCLVDGALIPKERRKYA
jgi:hypothetical protein